jgi:hypothetical protein
MLQLLEQWQRSLGLVGLACALFGAGFVAGLAVGLLGRRRPPAPSSTAPAMPDVAPTATVEAKGSTGEKRRNPRRPGRSVEVYVAIPGDTQKYCKGVVLNRSVGGLGVLVGDEYQVGSAIAVLPVTASDLTPWVEVEVKSCRRNGDDWELGLQFIKMPPYSTMLLFG